jgi:hypothetical protein
MYIQDRRVAKFMQELTPIICLSIVQIWWSFKFPAFEKLGAPWHTLAAIIVSIAGITVIVYLLSGADKYTSQFNLEYLDGAPNASFLKKLEKILLLSVVTIGMLFAWYNDFYNMPGIYYMIQYAYCIVLFIALYRAAYRYPEVP